MVMSIKARRWAARLGTVKDLMVAGDIITVILMIVLSGVLFVAMPAFLQNGVTGIEIKRGTVELGRFSLESDRTLDVEGPLGKTVVRISKGQAFIIESPCSNKYCINMGHIGASGGVLVCVPNEIIISSGQNNDNGLDAISR